MRGGLWSNYDLSAYKCATVQQLRPVFTASNARSRKITTLSLADLLELFGWRRINMTRRLFSFFIVSAVTYFVVRGKSVVSPKKQAELVVSEA